MTDPVPLPPVTAERRRRAQLAVASSVADGPGSRAEQRSELRLLLAMLGLDQP